MVRRGRDSLALTLKEKVWGELLQAYVPADDLEQELAAVRSRMAELRGAIAALQEQE